MIQETPSPFELFTAWFEDAEKSEPIYPNAVALASATPEGLPSVRQVLLKSHDTAGFVFYTNLESRKGRELRDNPNAALGFHWKSLSRQVRIEGPVTLLDDAQADAYFATRPRESRIGAWASKQSAPLESRFAFEKRLAAKTAKYPLGTIPRPPFWSGFRLAPVRMEFWQEEKFRLHNRLLYERGADDTWTRGYLYP